MSISAKQAAKKFVDFTNDISRAVHDAGFMCMPNEIGINLPGADIEDNEEINLDRVFTSFWLIRTARKFCSIPECQLNERVQLCLALIGLSASEEAKEKVKTLFP